MSNIAIKNKINKSLEKMNSNQLQSAYQIFKEFVNQQEQDNMKIDKNWVEKKIATGVSQLDNKEGTDFRTFLNEMNKDYGSGK